VIPRRTAAPRSSTVLPASRLAICAPPIRYCGLRRVWQFSCQEIARCKAIEMSSLRVWSMEAKRTRAKRLHLKRADVPHRTPVVLALGTLKPIRCASMQAGASQSLEARRTVEVFETLLSGRLPFRVSQDAQSRSTLLFRRKRRAPVASRRRDLPVRSAA
jgi:hypothetical protein